MYNKHIREAEQNSNRLQWARQQVALAEAALDRAANPILINVSGYLADCADANRVATFRDAAERGYAVPASALASALNDAVALKWIGHSGDFRIFWRDAGLTDECPMVRLSKHCKVKRKP